MGEEPVAIEQTICAFFGIGLLFLLFGKLYAGCRITNVGISILAGRRESEFQLGKHDHLYLDSLVFVFRTGDPAP